jgi:hypothetical protein
MKNIYFLLILFLFTTRLSAQPFFSNYYAPADTFVRNQSLAMTGGSFYQLLNRNASTEVISKISSTGSILYTKTLALAGGPLSDLAIIKSDGLDLIIAEAAYVNGATIAFTKMDSSLLPSWTTILDAGDITIPSSIQKSGTDYYFSGYRDYPTGSGFTFDITLAKFNSNGSLLWANAYGDNNYSYSNEASVTTADGGIIIAGEKFTQADHKLMVARFDAAGNQVWLKTVDIGTFFLDFAVAGMTMLPDSSIVIAGSPYNINNNTDLVLVGIDLNGTHLFTNRYYNIGYFEQANGIIYDSQGNIAVAGNYRNATDVNDQGYFILRTDTGGNILSSNKLVFPLGFSGGIYNTNHTFLELPGSGYVLNGYFSQLVSFPNYYHPAIVETSYSGGLNCGTAPTQYAFTLAAISSTVTNGPVLNIDNNITATPSVITFNTNAILSQGSICNVLGEEETRSSVFNIYPNPAQDHITIATAIKSASDLTCTITDITGRIVIRKNLLASEDRFTVDVSQLTAGIYTINVTGGENAIVKLLVVD